MTKATASKDVFFKAIVEQRAFEFAGESLRKADLIRWNLLKVKMDEAKAKMTDLPTDKVLMLIFPRNCILKLLKTAKH